MTRKDQLLKNPTLKKIWPKTKKALSFFRYPSRIILDLTILFVVLGTIIVGYFFWKNPVETQLSSANVAQTSIIYDRTGEHVLYEMHGEENRKVINHEEIPDAMRVTTIAAEDNNFYSHSGIDLKAIARSLKADVTSNEMQQGASTITQQLARNVFLTRQKTLQRKISEIILAFRIESKYTKDQILDMYLNQVPYGSNAYGIESASETFFGKNAKDLTLDESALLAALPNATTYYSPYGNHKDELIKKQQRILDKIKELGLVDGFQVDEAKNVNTFDKIIPLKQSISAPHFVFYIKDQLVKMYGEDAVKKGGYKIITTLDWNKQQLAESSIQNNLLEIQKYGATNAAMVSIDPKTGEILAMVGSRDYFDKSIDGQVNVATSPRQPGSSFKPFAYATAFEKGYQPETMLYDVPTNFGPDGTGQDYKPSNYDGSSHGLVSMRQALSNSLNIPAVKTLYLAGIKDTIYNAQKMGISTLTDQNRYGLALVLGGAEVTLLDETSAYGVFANDGKRNPATGFSKIIDSSGNTIYESTPKNEQVIHQQIARKIDSILSDNGARSLVFGTGSKLNIPGRTVAAKTGTTQDFHDAWIVGFTPSIVTGVWVGNNNNTPMHEGADGSYVAAPIWNTFMSQILNNYPNENFTDYEKYNFSNSTMPEIKYFKSGKEISAEKAKKAEQSKIEVKMELPVYSADGSSMIAEMQNTTDPMILRWREALKDPQALLDSVQNNNGDKKN
ncbi:MAG: PBP1A family penicillin-binding protein [Parcubacteria group bacterium]|jgi:1A family penicillin-binding protein